MPVIGIIEDDPLFAHEVGHRIENALPDTRVRYWRRAEEYLAETAVSAGDDPLDMLLLDLNLPGMSGVELLKHLWSRDGTDPCAAITGPPVLVLSNLATEHHVFDALKNGAVGYILKTEIGDIVSHIKVILEGGAFMSPTIAVRVIAAFFRNSGTPRSYSGTPAASTTGSDGCREQELTTREKDVLELLVCGLSARGAADKLHLSPHTVRVHVKRIYQKLHVSNKAELMRRAQVMGYF